MNANERILKALNHEEPDRVPIFEGSIDNLSICNHFGVKYSFQGAGSALKMAYYALFGSKKLLTKLIHRISKRKSAVKIGLKYSIELYKKIGLDMAITPLSLLPKFYNKKGYIDEYGRVIEFKKNPADNMDIGYYMGGYFKDFEDYEAFPPLDPDLITRELAYKVGKELEEENNGKIFVIPGTMGLMEGTWEGFGLENFSRLMAHPKEMQKVFDDRGKFVVEMTKRAIEWGETDAIYLFDDYGYKAGLFMSPRNYKKYVFPWIKEVCNVAHKSGLKVMLHSCGDILKIFEDLINCGVDGINPIEPTTANPDFDIFKLKKQYGDKVTLIGNVSPMDLADKDPDYIVSYTKKLIKEVAPGGGFILSSGHSLNPAVKLENYLAMLETHKKYGAYPIKVN